VIALLCREVRQRDIVTAIGSLKDARGRIACCLLQLAREFGVREGQTIRIAYRLTRQDIADRAGVTIETAIRVLSEYQQQGIIRTQSQIIEILDVPRLQEPPQCGECQFDCSVFARPAVSARRV
jgi:CRP-like cAMP-binding protein